MPAVLGAELLIDLGIFALFACCLLLRKGWVSTLGALLLRTADLIGGISFSIKVFRRGVTIGLGPVADVLRGINADALSLIGAGITVTSYAGHRLWSWTAYTFESLARVTAGLAEWTYGELRHVARVVVPGYVGAKVDPLTRAVTVLSHRIASLATHPTTIVRPITRIIDPRIRVLEREVDTLSRAVGTIGAAAHSPSVALPSHVPGWIFHGIDELRAKLGRVTRILTPAGALGLVAGVTLSALDLGWLKCRGVTRAGRALCGAGGLLEAILNDAIDALIVADLCQFVAALSYAARQFQPVLLEFVNVENALIGCRGATLPAALEVPALSLPPVTGLVVQ